MSDFQLFFYFFVEVDLDHLCRYLIFDFDKTFLNFYMKYGFREDFQEENFKVYWKPVDIVLYNVL